MAYKQLTHEQQYQILILHKSHHTQARIGDLTGVHQSTICRILRKNNGLRGFNCPDNKFFKPKERKHKGRPTKLTPSIVRIIELKLSEKWSPEQISGWLHRTIAFTISYWTIYAHIKKDKKAGGTLYQHLRRKGKKYKKRDPVTGCRSHTKNRISIHKRPDIVNDRLRCG